MNLQQKDAVLVLADGTVFRGKSCGATGTSTGEIAFNTGMTGYQEIFTDPSYFGQMVVMTSSHIGNYGVHEDEIESQSLKIKGLVVKKFARTPSRYGDKISSLQSYLEDQGVVGICELDTRAIVRYIRDNGAQNAIISTDVSAIEDLKKQAKDIPSMKGLELASAVSTKKTYVKKGEKTDYKVVLLDFGVKRSIITNLTNRGCEVTVVPYNTTAEDVLALQPDGIMLSNGPGDPEPLTDVIKTIRTLTATDIPIFGICLGHQLLALSQGLETEKMHNGHRGINHPILNLTTKRGEITSQNHGFVVSMESAKKNNQISVTHRHLNDDTLAGIAIKGKDIFSVQYHPEASPGPHDSRYLFDDFVKNIAKRK